MDLSTPPHSHIGSLPPETLITIFREVTHEPIALMQLALACRNWRRIVMGTGELWSRITVDQKSNESRLCRQLDLSGETLLELFIKISAPVALSRLVLEWSSPRPINERVSVLSVHIPYYRDETDDFSGKSLSGGHSWPHLRRLMLYSDSMRFRIHFRAPNLETFDLEGTNFRGWEYVGLSSALCYLGWETREPDADVAVFLRAATYCPNLSSLRLKAKLANILLPELSMDDVPLWPKMADLALECDGASIVDILVILFHSPHVTDLDLQFRTLARSSSRDTPKSGPPLRLRKLEVGLAAEPGNRGEYVLGRSLLEGILERHDPADLETFSISQCIIPSGDILAPCFQLQNVYLDDVILPQNFIESLSNCPLIQLCIYDSKEEDVATSTHDLDVTTKDLVFTGRAFTGVCTQLQKLDLLDIVVHPGLMMWLSQLPNLETVRVRLLSVSTDLETLEDDWYDVEAITPLPALDNFDISLGGRQDELVPLYSLDDPGARHMVSAAVQLTRRMTCHIYLRPTALRATDVARFLVSPDRVLSGIDIHFDMDEDSPEILSIYFAAHALTVPPSEPDWLTLQAGIKRTELVGVTDVILEQLLLEGVIKAVRFNATALDAACVENERNPGAAGLQYLLRRAEATRCVQASDSDD